MRGQSKFGLPQKQSGDKESRYIRIPVYLLLLIFFSLTAFAGGSIYWFIKKDNELEKLRRVEIELQNQIKQRELLLQQKDQHIEQLERRVEIIDAIKGLSRADIDKKQVRRIAKQIDVASRKYGHDPMLLVAMMATESSFRPAARSSVGARGLMQLMPETGSHLSKQVQELPSLIGYESKEELPNLTYRDIEGNVQLGALYLTQLLVRYKNLDHALYAYNMGPTLVDERIKNGGPLPYNYREKIMRIYTQLKNRQKIKDAPLPALFADDQRLANAIPMP